MSNNTPASGRQVASARWFLIVLSVLYLAAIWIGTHLPASAIPKISHIDKLLHGFAYFGLAALATSSLVSFVRPTQLLIVLLLFVLLALAMCDELSQIPVPGRNGDIYDFVADGVGIICGVGCVLLMVSIWRYAKKSIE